MLGAFDPAHVGYFSDYANSMAERASRERDFGKKLDELLASMYLDSLNAVKPTSEQKALMERVQRIWRSGVFLGSTQTQANSSLFTKSENMFSPEAVFAPGILLDSNELHDVESQRRKFFFDSFGETESEVAGVSNEKWLSHLYGTRRTTLEGPLPSDQPQEPFFGFENESVLEAADRAIRDAAEEEPK
jgi:hypothetical protein